MSYTSIILLWAITWRKKMKKFVLAAAFAGAASTAFAGNVSEPIMEMAPVVVMEETAGSSSSAGLIIPLILVVLIAAALAD
jgi:hypothetical protein